MKKYIITIVIVVLLLLPLTSSMAMTIQIDQPKLEQTKLKGVVVIDDQHKNDYINGDMDDIVKDLDSLGFLVYYASELGGLISSLKHAHYLIISTPGVNFTASEIDAIKDWFASGSRNLLVASRGDYSNLKIETINELLIQLGAVTRLQDDNIYTTNKSVYKPWYIRTNNFNTTAMPELFSGVNTIEFFSPSSLAATDPSKVNFIIYAEQDAYQKSETDGPPEVIYDDTPDGVGGDKIPLATFEKLTVGNYSDRILATGTTLWSDYDYLDQNEFGDITFLHNIMEYFYNQTLTEQGEIKITVPDTVAPTVKISFPRNNSIVKGTINITLQTYDKFGVTNYSIYLDGNLVSNYSYYVWDTTTSHEGYHNITATASDDAGNIGRATHIVFVNQSYVPTLPNKIKIMEYNIKESGIKPQWIDVIKEENPDIAILVETGNFDDNNNQLLNEILQELNYYFQDQVPYHAYTEQGAPTSYTGITILSRFSIIEAKSIYDLYLDNGELIHPAHKFLYAKLDVFNTSVHIIGAHLQAFAGEEEALQREKEQEGINNFMDSLGEVPLIYTGDLNSESPQDPWPSDLGKGPVSILINSNDSRAPKHHLFKDVYRMLNTAQGYTFGGYSRIDFIFANQYLWPKIYQSQVVNTTTAQEGSDHLPVTAMLDFTSGIYIGPPSSPVNLKAEYDPNQNQVVLTWEKPIATFNLPIIHYYVYKIVNGEKTLIATLDGNTLRFVDSNVKLSQEYIYQIVAENEYGLGETAVISLTTTEIINTTTKKTPVEWLPIISTAIFITIIGKMKKKG